MGKKETLEMLEALKNNELLNTKYKEKLEDAISLISDEELPEITIYTDGGCLVNPGGPGAYGIVYLKDDEVIKKESQGFKMTTNNRMELRGPLKAMESLKEPHKVTIISDSKYFTDAINNGWIENWLKTNFKNGKVKNIDLWKKIIIQLERHDVIAIWVKGHNDNKYNEECDRLCTRAYKDTSNLIDDEGFRKEDC